MRGSAAIISVVAATRHHPPQAAGSVLMHPHDRGINHLHRRVMPGCQCIHDPIQDASPPPADKAFIASGKEVLAYGFRKYRIGEVIGTQTEGAVIAPTAFLVGRGMLLLAVEDVQVDGVRLEGVGVAPTIEVQAGPTSAGAIYPQLSRAVALLSACSRSSYARR
jgi:hypothetical protein